jgi:serine-type D-Ala-D-Ala carboxypeptidase/endopeptidase (penicillin-binding protein 4)
MKRIFFIIAYSLMVIGANAQTINQKLQKAFGAFEKDSQLKHAISSLYVIDASTGQVVFDKNSQIGLAPASTQKIITSVTAFELLGKGYRYKTEFGYDGTINKDTLFGNLYVVGRGDPTLGSWRYKSTNPDSILSQLNNSVDKRKIRWLKGNIYIDERKFETQAIPNGWIWEDIGNYYGAGANSFNWKENQYDIFLKSGEIEGEQVKVIKTTIPKSINDGDLFNELKTGKSGTGDNAYAYFNPRSKSLYLRGTIPPNQNSFSISLSTYSSSWFFYREFNNQRKFEIEKDAPRTYANFESLQKYGSIPKIYYSHYGLDSIAIDSIDEYSRYQKPVTNLYTHYSPSLDSIIYWFNKKSINLYGEALIKTFAYEKQGFGSTDSGVAIVKKFWKEKGMDENELNIVDGSGLSPLNRVTTHAQVEILKYAKTKDWFPYFLNALPEYNKMTMKSGTIRGVKGFCGYHKASNGKEYIFSFLVNNYNGSASALVNKMYKVLDLLK